MQYLLTEKEYKELLEAGEKVQQKLNYILLDLCKKVCNHMPVNAGWREIEPAPWTCIRSTDDIWYCDGCPCSSHMPLYW